jgi:hypothetical protein
MKRLIEKIKNLFLIAVASSLLASAAGFVWGLIKTLVVIMEFILSYGKVWYHSPYRGYGYFPVSYGSIYFCNGYV